MQSTLKPRQEIHLFPPATVASENLTNVDTYIKIRPQDDHLPLQQVFPLLCVLLQNAVIEPLHATKPLPKDNFGVDLSHGARLPLPLDLSVVPVAALLGVVWVEVDHNDHFRLQLVPLVYRTGPRANILSQQLNHPVLWVAVVVNVIPDQFAVWRQATHHHRCFLHSAAWEPNASKYV